ncbi:MAG: nucleotide exchange factor GrpE [Candidatus Acidiferrales bacterium]
MSGEEMADKHSRNFGDERSAESQEPQGGSSHGESESAAGNPDPHDAKALAAHAAKLDAELRDLRNTLLRRQADFDNYRKRVERERNEERHRGAELVIEKLLPVLDGFERAIAAHSDPAYDEYRKGVELIERQMLDVLSRQGLERIDAKGKPFDPHLHHAIDRVETEEHPDGTVLEVLQPGFLFHGKVLRPAMVRVAAHPATHAARTKSFLE